METISLQMMDTNCKPVHACEYSVPRPVEQQLQQSKEIARLMDIGALEEDYSSEWASLFPIFSIPNKNKRMSIRVVTDFKRTGFNLLLKPKKSHISYSKCWKHRNDPFNERLYL
jgi:hypothetical protein